MKLSHAVVVLATVCLVGSAVAYNTEDSDLESSDVEPVVEESLLDLDSASKARRDSYQSNVGTVYTHLNEIIRKILVHKKAWSVKYESDLTRVAKELADKVSAERTARSGKDKADAALAVAKSEADRKNKAWLKAHASLQQKKKDAEKERSDLKVLFTKGNGLKAGEIAMIVKIRCMLSTFNKDDKYKCDDMKAVIADAKAALSKSHTDTLASGGKLQTGQYLLSHNGNYKAIMQGDGNFVIYKGANAVYNTHTFNHPGAKLAFQTDGNLVIYDKKGKAQWNTHTAGRKSTKMVMQNDGNLVIYNGGSAVWSSKNGRA